VCRYIVDVGRYIVDVCRCIVDVGRYIADVCRYIIDVGRYMRDISAKYKTEVAGHFPPKSH